MRSVFTFLSVKLHAAHQRIIDVAGVLHVVLVEFPVELVQMVILLPPLPWHAVSPRCSAPPPGVVPCSMTSIIMGECLCRILSDQGR